MADFVAGNTDLEAVADLGHQQKITRVYHLLWAVDEFFKNNLEA